jgi:hypothetical protein
MIRRHRDLGMLTWAGVRQTGALRPKPLIFATVRVAVLGSIRRG